MTATLAPPPRDAAAAGPARLLAGRPELADHLGRLGPPPLLGRDLITEAEQAGLRGRGGGGFPTARKLAAVAVRRGPTVVVANGTEGEPLSAKDKVLLTRSPHLVLDGLDEAAAAVGAHRRIVAIEAGDHRVESALRQAITERAHQGWPGVEVVRTPARYLSGQETALVDLIDGGAGRPTGLRPDVRGVGGRPTLVDNVETLAHLALIARFGARWYRYAGAHDDPGTALVTAAGAVEQPGVCEIPLGLPLRRLLRRAHAAPARAVLVGGYYGRWLPADVAARVSLDRAGLAAAGAGLGCGVVAVVDDSTCAVAELARVAEWYAASSAGQCGACTWGLRDLASATRALGAGTPDPADDDIRRWTAMVRGRGGCALPDGAAAFLSSGIEVFEGEIAEHRAGRCRRPDRHLLRTPAPEAWR